MPTRRGSQRREPVSRLIERHRPGVAALAVRHPGACMKNLVVMLFLVTLGCLGCGTFASHDPQGYSSQVNSGAYRGVREDWRAIAHPECMEGLGAPLRCFDMPFSFVADTLWLPFDATAGTGKTEADTHKDASHDRRFATDYIVGATYQTRKPLAVRKGGNALSLFPADRVSDLKVLVDQETTLLVLRLRARG